MNNTFTNKTVELALRDAANTLGVDIEDIEYKVVQVASKGFLGIGSKDAIIEIISNDLDFDVADDVVSDYKADDTNDIQETRFDFVTETKEENNNLDTEEKDVSSNYDAEEKKAEKFLSELFIQMGINAKANISKNSKGLDIDITGDNMGLLIGRRGDTLDAIQYLTSLAVNKDKGENSYCRVNIDIEDYRHKREVALTKFAGKVASRVEKYGKSVTLEPMASYERRIIHFALQNYKGIVTYSTGSEPNRRVVVAKDKNNAE